MKLINWTTILGPKGNNLIHPFHIISYIEHLFMCLLAIFLSSRSSAHFLTVLFVRVCVCVFFTLSCMSCLYILGINPLSVASIASIFSHWKKKEKIDPFQFPLSHEIILTASIPKNI